MPRPPALQPIDVSHKATDADVIKIDEKTMALTLTTGTGNYVVLGTGVEQTPSKQPPLLAVPTSLGGDSSKSGASAPPAAAGAASAVASPVGALQRQNSMSGQGPSPVGTPFAGTAMPFCMLGKVAFEHLEMLDILGQGSQGRVRKVRNRENGDILALKSIGFSSNTEELRKALVVELEHTTALKHPDVVSSYEAYFRNGKMYVLMEFMDCGTCSDVAKRNPGGLPDKIVAYIAKHVTIGLAHCHNEKVIHRDIKPANILCNSSGQVKISDFGVAGDGRAQLHVTNIGSTPYMSPERIKSQPYTTACDIWSLGITVAELALGTYPFGNVKGKIFDLCEIIAGSEAAPKWKALGAPGRVFNEDMIDFCRLCLLPEETRPSAETLSSHKFLQLCDDLKAEEVGEFFKSKRRAAEPSPPSGPSAPGSELLSNSLTVGASSSAFSAVSPNVPRDDKFVGN
jgi:mitogen-activated protein kinase kinase 1